jgi:hypothetical protein
MKDHISRRRFLKHAGTRRDHSLPAISRLRRYQPGGLAICTF